MNQVGIIGNQGAPLSARDEAFSDRLARFSHLDEGEREEKTED
jgi:hypothetical protein